jgi:hypothetical protein
MSCSSLDDAVLMKESNNRILHHVSECPVVLSSCTSGHCADWHEQMMKAAGTLNRMTGFLLVYPTCVLHFLEAESAALTKILLALQANAKSEAPVLEGICVLSYTEDVHSSGPTQHTGFIHLRNCFFSYMNKQTMQQKLKHPCI